MGIETVAVSEIVKMAVGKKLDIPEFQREFVWQPEKVKFLAESLYRGYPVGSFLLWDSLNYQEAKHADGAEMSSWIVDGQQRTTALCILLGMKPYWWPKAEDWNNTLKRYNPLVCIHTESPDDYSEFVLSNPIYSKDPKWISVREILSIPTESQLFSYITNKAKLLAQDGEETIQVLEIIQPAIQLVWRIRERLIPLIKTSHEVEDVAEIFSRLNSAGTRVKEADVMLALAAVRNPGWIKSEYAPFTADLEERGWPLSPGVFIRTMTGISLGKARLKEISKEFWNKDSMEPIWKQATNVIFEVIKLLDYLGVHSAELLPSENSLIPLFALHNKFRKNSSYSFNKSFVWFLRANREGRYSGSAVTALEDDLKLIQSSENQDEALVKISNRLFVPLEFTKNDFLNRYDRIGNKFFRTMMFLILVDQKAKDWVDKTALSYDKKEDAQLAGFVPNWHHIFPKSMFKNIPADLNLTEDMINSIANITVISSLTNVHKLRSKSPNHYIKEFNISSQELDTHLIPNPWCNSEENIALEGNLWSLSEFGSFIAERATRLAEEANKFFDMLMN